MKQKFKVFISGQKYFGQEILSLCLAKGYEVGNLDETLVLVRAGDSMVSRRRGKEYIKGEWQLFKLKHSLKLQPLLPNFFIFTLRASLRILPTRLLKIIYKFLRQKR